MTSPETLIGLITLVIALGTILWQLSATLTALRQQRGQMNEELLEMKKAIAELRNALARLDAVPLHEQRITQLERVVETQSAQLRTLWQKLFSVDKHLAVVRAGSQHDINDTDPPPEE